MRDTGPVNKELTGDQTQSVAYIGVARTQLGILKNLMALGGLPTGTRTVRMEDGTTIRVTSINGTDAIHVDTAPPAAPPPEEPPEEYDFPEPEIPQPEIPEVSFTGPGVVFTANTLVNFPNPPLKYPLLLNGILLNGPSKQQVAGPLVLEKPLTLDTTNVPTVVVGYGQCEIASGFPYALDPASKQPGPRSLDPSYAGQADWVATCKGLDLRDSLDSVPVQGFDLGPVAFTWMPYGGATAHGTPAQFLTEMQWYYPLKNREIAVKAKNLAVPGNKTNVLIPKGLKLSGQAQASVNFTVANLMNVAINGVPVYDPVAGQGTGFSVPCDTGYQLEVSGVVGSAPAWTSVITFSVVPLHISQSYANGTAGGPGEPHVNNILKYTWNQESGDPFTGGAGSYSSVSQLQQGGCTGTLTIDDGYGDPIILPISVVVACRSI